jgi:hypothetical protein
MVIKQSVMLKDTHLNRDGLIKEFVLPKIKAPLTPDIMTLSGIGYE